MPSSRRKARNDGVARTADGRPFHARGAATRKAERAGRRGPSSGGDDGRRRQPPDGCRPRSTAGRCRSDNGASEHTGGSEYLAPNGHIRSSGLHHVGDLTCCRLHHFRASLPWRGVRCRYHRSCWSSWRALPRHFTDHSIGEWRAETPSALCLESE